MLHKLQYISQGKTPGKQLANIQNALDGGCKWIQLRFKEGNPSQLVPLAEKVKELCTFYHATFIINDHVELALKTNADGVHLGLNDMPVTAARNMLGDKKIIGGTANTLANVKQRAKEGCNYIGLGPFRFTSTKKELSPVLGLEGIATIVQEANITVPVYAIGGIIVQDAPALMKTGIYGLAVSGDITGSPDKKILIEKYYGSLYEKISHRQ